jgi:transcription initiation factor TFIIIB Brf1 subunit/transcription initiation factor TFIIB
MSKRVIKPKFRSFPRARHESSDESDDEELNELFKQATLFKNNELKEEKELVSKNKIKTFLKDEKEEENEVEEFINYKNKECLHSESISEHNFIYCKQCGLQLSDDSNGSEIGRNDSIRLQYKKMPEKGISKDLEIYNLPLDVINLADKLYAGVTKEDIKRGNLRKGIIFACVFHAYHKLNKPQTPDTLQKVFNISRKNISKGLTYFCLGNKERGKTEYITAEHFIPKILEKLNIKQECLSECLQLYKSIENKSSLLNRSNPQSVSKGVVYYYLRKLDSKFDLKKYSEEIQLSEITITRICNTIDNLLAI